jgi:hypothetical protein
VGASYAYARDEYSELRASVAAIRASASEIATECPSALTYAPRDAAFTKLGHEANLALVVAGAKPLRSILLRVVHAIGKLRWSDRALTRLVRARAAEEGEIAALVSPNLCADIEAWKASAYAALPQSASAFIARGDAILSASGGGPFEEPREARILRRLRRYEGRTERATAKRVEALEARIGMRVTAAVNSAQAKLAAALGVSQL